MTTATTTPLTDSDIRDHSGGEGYRRVGIFGRRIVATTGVQYIEDNGAGWLIDAIASHLVANPKMKRALARDERLRSLHFWTVKSKKDGSGFRLYAQADSGEPKVVEQIGDYTDLWDKRGSTEPLKIWCGLSEDGNGNLIFVLYMPSEH